MRQKKRPSSSEPILSRRERELLDNLAVLKSQGKKTTVVEFARDNGYANKSALRHFPVLRQELSEYVTQCSRTHQKQPRSLRAKYLESQLERQSREIERLKKQTKTIAPLKAKVAKLENEKNEDRRQKRVLRGMLGTVISFLSSSEFATARDLSARIEKQAKALIEDEPEDD
jgi:hypothetical protein